MNDPRNHDFITNLPSSIIHKILARLPIREAIRSSLLSRRLKNKWVSRTQLVFENNECCENFITNVLYHHKGPIHKFETCMPLQTNSPKFDEWMLCLSRNDIRDLCFFIEYDQPTFYKIHSSLYLCQNLTSLELFNCELAPPPPFFPGFLFLRVLLLQNVNMYPHGIETVFANSPLLEKLELRDSASLELRINAPNLRCVHLRGVYVRICLHAPLLAEMSVELSDHDFPAEHPQQDSWVCNYAEFLGGITNLEKLKLTANFHFMKNLSACIKSCPHSLVFPHLKIIELYEVNFQSIREMLVVARLILGAPNLEKLVVSNLDGTNEDVSPGEGDVSLMDITSAVNLRLKRLREVKISGATGGPVEMKHIKYLVENSPVLERMEFDKLNPKAQVSIIVKLMGWSYASPDVMFTYE